MGQKVVIVNEKDEVLGVEEREKAHQGEGLLHRAVATFLFNQKGELLITKRSKFKKLWPCYWDASCCTHNREGEDYVKTGERRLPEELGIKCKLKFLLKFKYSAKYKKIGSENEMCALLVGKLSNSQEIKPDPKEVEDFKWIRIEKLLKEIKKNPQKYTPWLKIALKEYLKNLK